MGEGGLIARGLALAALASAAWGIGAARAQAPLQNVTLAMPSISLSYAMDYIAADRGFFEKHGLKVTMVVITGVGATNAVIAGSAEFSNGSGASLTRAVARGQKLLAIVGVLQRASIDIVLRKTIADAAHFDPKASLADRAKVLRGHTIAIAGVNSIDQVYLNLVARRGGYDPDAIPIAVMAADNALAAFASGQIDGVSISPPTPQLLVLNGSAVTIASGFDGDPPDMIPVATTIVMTRPETCAQRPAICEGMGQAMKEAALVLRDHPDEAAAVMAKRLPNLDPKLIAAMLPKVREAAPDPPVVSVLSLKNSDRMNVDAGLLKPEEMLSSYDDLTTDKYVK
jgi:ABC-type nitrate/sulfonate/bicarbonate transport system substrate-binding protein